MSLTYNEISSLYLIYMYIFRFWLDEVDVAMFVEELKHTFLHLGALCDLPEYVTSAVSKMGNHVRLKLIIMWAKM